ncbi:MAG TPA: PAS domain-containing protein, partial [bacterium]|nr:PAS domain-containing protein [bacterium]
MTRPEEVLLRSDIAKRIIENIDYGVYVTTPDRRMVYWNAAAERITGYSAAEVEGKGCWDNILKHVDRHGKRLCGEEACPLHKSMLCNARQEMPQVVYALTKGGVRTPVQVQCAPLHDDQGRVIGGVEIFRDVRTETADIELARKLQRQLVQRPQPALAGVEVVSRYHAAEMLSGDFYAVLMPTGANDRPSPHNTLLMGD